MLFKKFKALVNGQRAGMVYAGIALLGLSSVEAATLDDYEARVAYYKANTGHALDVLSSFSSKGNASFEWKDTVYDGDYIYSLAALGFGMPNLAAQTLRNASGDSGELARIAYAEELFSQGLFSQSLDRLNEIGKLGSEFAKAKGQYLRGQLLIQSGNIEEAERLFEKWRGDSFLQAYLGLNIGVWFAEQNKLAEAAEWLSDTASMKFAQDEEWLTLKDRANVYLGSVYNWMGKPGLARKALEKVRLDGVDANRALLGLGWTDVARSQNKEALAPWSYLSEQPTSDPSVQESLLLVPFALGRLGAHGKASNIFSKAINVYEQEITLLKTTKKSVANGSLLKAIAQSHRSNKGEWQSNIRKALNKKFLPYFINALKKPEIEQLFQSYIDIVEMEKRVQTWAQKGRSYPSTQAKAILKKMQPLKQAYAKKINQHLVQLLDEHITRLKDYQGHANFSLAESFERVANSQAGGL